MSPAVKNKLQNFLIVLLSVTAALLFLECCRLTWGNGGVLSRLFSDPGATVSDSTGQPETAALPLRFAAAGDYATRGQLGLTTAEESFSVPGALLREALGSASGRQTVEEAAFLSALDGTALCYDFLTVLPASLLGRRLNCAIPQGLDSVRRLLLSVQGGSVYLYCGSEESCLRYQTKVSVTDLTALVNSCELSGVIFAGQLSQAEGLDPLSLLPSEDVSLPQLSAASCPAESALWNLLGFNPRTNNYYLESDGTQVILEGDSTLRLQPGAVIRYEGSGLSLSDRESFPDAGDAVEAGERFLAALLQSCGSNAGLLLRQVQATADGWILHFDYHAGGYPIRSGSGGAMASLTLRGTTAAELELNLRRYTVTEETSLLLPLTQALAIARRYDGAELNLGYLDGGGDALSAGWLAE